MKYGKSILVFAAITFLSQAVLGAAPPGAPTPTASLIIDPVCEIIETILQTLQTISGTLVVIMFIYGGIKYVFAADDAGARKQGKQTCIHALIGGILIVIAGEMVDVLTLAICPAGAVVVVP